MRNPAKREKPQKRSVFKAFWWRRGRDSNPCGVAPKRFSRPPRYDRFDTSPYMKLSFDRNHQIFNCFRNSFRNALLCCCRSAEKVRCCKAFQGFCDRCDRKFSSSPCSDYFTFQQQKTSVSWKMQKKSTPVSYHRNVGLSSILQSIYKKSSLNLELGDYI